MACTTGTACRRFTKNNKEQQEHFDARNPNPMKNAPTDVTGLKRTNTVPRPKFPGGKSRPACIPRVNSPVEYYVMVTNDRVDAFSASLFSRGNIDNLQNMLMTAIKNETGIEISPQDEQPMLDILINQYYEYFTDRYNFSLQPANADDDDLPGMINEINCRAVDLIKREVYVGMRDYLYAKTAPLNSDHMIPVGLRGHYGIDARKEFKDERSLELNNVIGMTKVAPRLSIFTRQIM